MLSLMRRWLWRTMVLAALCTILPGPVCAQLAVGADLAYRTNYVWRGVRRSSRPVVQPGAFLSWQPRGWTLTSGAWASLEVTRAAAFALTDAGTNNRLAELDYWVEAHTRVQPFDFRFGTVYYDFQGAESAGGRGDSWDTGELYGAVSVLLTNLSTIGVTAAYDYSAVDGAFVALEAVQHIPILALHGTVVSGLLRAELGASLGQELDPADPDARGYFAEGGVAYTDLSGALRVHGDRFGAYTALHWQFSRDSLTRLVARNRSQSRQHWLDAGVSVLLGARARERR